MTFSPLIRAGFKIAVILCAIAAGIGPSRAGDVANGRKIAAVKCALCHGLDGVAKLPGAPNLSGQVEQYLLAQMKAYHDGTRKNDMMSLVAPTLSETDEADLAAYYAAIEVTIGKVPGE